MVICTILSNFGQMNRNFSYIRRVTGIIKRIGIRDMWLKDKLFGNKKKQETFTLCIPEETLAIFETADLEGHKALMVINQALKDHQDDSDMKQVFCYYCSIIFNFIDVDDNMWPSSEEFAIMRDYVETIDKGLKGLPEHPNALFVARVTHKGTCQMIWMLHDAQTAVKYLDEIIAKGNQVRDFEYHIEGDPQWKSIEWFLQDFPTKDQ